MRVRRYLKVLVQEMTVKADQGFINAIIPFFGTEERSSEQLSKDFQLDLETVALSLKQVSAGSASKGHKNFYDMLHFSPLKVTFTHKHLNHCQNHLCRFSLLSLNELNQCSVPPNQAQCQYIVLQIKRRKLRCD